MLVPNDVIKFNKLRKQSLERKRFEFDNSSLMM